MKKFGYSFIIAQVVIILLMFVVYRTIGLLPYINMAFVVGGTLTFIGLVIYVVSNGFFDVFTLSMRKTFTPKSRLDVESMRAPSELLSTRYGLFLRLGVTILITMGIFLFVYYA